MRLAGEVNTRKILDDAIKAYEAEKDDIDTDVDIEDGELDGEVSPRNSSPDGYC